MAGPNRQWHIGDHGPTAWADRSPHAWCRDSHERKPRAHAEPDVIAEHVARSAPEWVKSQGRDPNDTVTMELPGMDPPIPNCMVTRIAAGLYGEGDDVIDDEVPWLLLFLREESEWAAAEKGDIRKREKLGWTP